MTEGRSDEIIQRLDLLVGIIQLAYAPQIAEARASFRSDAVTSGILDGAEDWVSSSTLQDQVAASAATSTRTVRRRINELVSMRALLTRGSSRSTEYRSANLI